MTSNFAVERLQTERKNWRKDHPPGFVAKPHSNKNGEIKIGNAEDFNIENFDEDFLKENSSANIYYVTRYAKTVYSSYDFSKTIEDVYVMFGRESTGIPHEILREHEDRLMRIPMVPEARSLNLSNCVALVAYEVLRQQNFPDLATEEAIKGPDFLFKE